MATTTAATIDNAPNWYAPSDMDRLLSEVAEKGAIVKRFLVVGSPTPAEAAKGLGVIDHKIVVVKYPEGERLYYDAGLLIGFGVYPFPNPPHRGSVQAFADIEFGGSEWESYHVKEVATFA